MSGHNIESHIKVYWNVFYALLAFTALTVGVTYIEFNSVFWTFFVGLSIACIKGYLVAAYFMHLNDETKTIYYLLGMTIFFLAVMMRMPLQWKNSAESSGENYLPYAIEDKATDGGYVEKTKSKNKKGDY
tara:strand:- start:190 stop:579 length:390 start_codon:yes stop_codon:yes gene_type:complete